MRCGRIPEFIGRVPGVATLDELDEEALLSILTVPRNALLKQYQKLFKFEKVKLNFTDEALAAVMMALQRSLLEQSDIVPVLKGFEFKFFHSFVSMPYKKSFGLKEGEEFIAIISPV